MQLNKLLTQALKEKDNSCQPLLTILLKTQPLETTNVMPALKITAERIIARSLNAPKPIHM